jgi:polyhydroxybutyrate depolymerase
VIALHGLGHDGAGYAGPGGWSGLAELAEARGFFLAYPDGVNYQLQTPFGSTTLRAWNASCCGQIEGEIPSNWLPADQTVADDVTYLRAVIAQMRSAYNVDDSRIFIQGLSNGAFMAHLMACEASDKIAAIAPHAGTFFTGDQVYCEPDEPVAVLHSHGTADTTIAYPGGTWTMGSGLIELDHIGAQAAADTWVAINSCSSTPSSSAPFDAVENLFGQETTVTTYGNDCAGGRTVELWTITDGLHVPMFTDGYKNALIDFFMAHPK